MSKITPELRALLKQTHQPIRDYINALERENRKLAVQNASLQAQQLTLTNQVKALTKKLKAGGVHMRITFADGTKIG